MVRKRRTARQPRLVAVNVRLVRRVTVLAVDHGTIIDVTHGDYARGCATCLLSRHRRRLTGRSPAAFRSIQPEDWSLTS
jgi:hypothetical protein